LGLGLYFSGHDSLVEVVARELGELGCYLDGGHGVDVQPFGKLLLFCPQTGWTGDRGSRRAELAVLPILLQTS